MRTDTAKIHTIEAGFPWALPPVTRVHLTPRARVRRFRNRILASGLAADLRDGYRRSLVVFGVFGLAFAAFVVCRGVWFLGVLLGAAW